MTTIEQFAAAWLDWTVAASWQLALLVCLIAALSWVLRGSSPHLRYGLWLLVLVKALLPPTLTASWGVGSWGIAPVVDAGWTIGVSESGVVGQVAGAEFAAANDRAIASETVAASAGIAARDRPLLVAWAAGCLALWLSVAWRYRRLMHRIHAMRHVDEGPARVELERLAARLSICTVPGLYATERATSPMLVGVLAPTIVLPESIIDRLDTEGLRIVLTHELVHWRRYDTWVGWWQVLVQGLFWFHPLVWWANARIRHERECACDEAVLRLARCDRDGYGETILRVLTAARGRSLVMANMVGIFERGSRLQLRLEEIMSFDLARRRYGWFSRAALVALALVLLPMAAPGVEADDDERTADASTAARPGTATPGTVATRSKTNWPTIVSTKPAIGATDVDPSLKEITVRFDRDMDVTGYSWTGGGEFFPPSPADARGAVWIDKRTCVLPVALKKGSFYRVGVNSTSYQNFRSELGVPVPPAAIYFVTSGATRGVASRVRVPTVASMSPENGAKGVDPGLKVLRVTFDMPMSIGSHSWTGAGPNFPTIPEGQQVRWSRDGKTCMLPVALRPGWRYDLGLNSLSHRNFTSKWGVPLEPVRYSFQTSGQTSVGDATAPPLIVKMVPENGATDVDPTLTEIRVTFDRPMESGFSWTDGGEALTGGGETFPTIAPGQKPYWSDDRQTCVLPVVLQPNRQYRLGLNSHRVKNFASVDGVSLEPVVYEFRTSPGNK